MILIQEIDDLRDRLDDAIDRLEDLDRQVHSMSSGPGVTEEQLMRFALGQMRSKGIQQKVVAEEMGITSATLSRILHGKRRTTLDKALQIIDRVGYKLEVLPKQAEHTPLPFEMEED